MFRLRRPARLQSNLLFAIFLLAAALRLVGAVCNLEANDPHMPVSEIMAYQHRIPADGEEWEAFQPKLYHATVAAALMLIPESRESLHTLAAQLISCAAGIATLWLLLPLLEEVSARRGTRALCFALVALNPKMIATSIQATNDAFVILFGTLALTAGWRYFRRPTWRGWALTSAGMLLVCVSKGNGLFVAMAVAITWLLALLPAGPRRRQLFLGGVVTALAFSVFVPLAGGYWARYRETGHAFYIQMDPSFPAHFATDTLAKRPGITSFVHGYLTFRLVDLLQNPVVSNESDSYALNRTSLWTYAYAGATTQHYDDFPLSWQSHSAATLFLLRYIYLLALLPALLLVWSYFSAVAASLRGLLRWQIDGDWVANALLPIAATGSVALLLEYAWQYRDFSCMKPIFCYPAIAAAAVFVARTLDRSPPQRGWFQLVPLSCVLMLAGQVAESAMMIGRLVPIRLHLI